MPKTCAEYQSQLIRKLNHFFDFDHNIFLFESSADIGRFIDTTRGSGHSTPQSVYVFKSDNDKITGLDSLKEIWSKNTFIIVVLGSANFEGNFNLLTRVRQMFMTTK